MTANSVMAAWHANHRVLATPGSRVPASSSC